MLTLSLEDVSGLLQARGLMSEEKMHRGHWLRSLWDVQCLPLLLYGVHAREAIAGFARGRTEDAVWAVYIRWSCGHISLRIRKGRHGRVNIICCCARVVVKK